LPLLVILLETSLLFVGYGVNRTQPHFILCTNRIFNHFRFNTNLNSLNQGEGSVFRLRKCVFRIPRLKLPLKTSFLEKKLEKIFFEKNPCPLGPLMPTSTDFFQLGGPRQNFEKNDKFFSLKKVLILPILDLNNMNMQKFWHLNP